MAWKWWKNMWGSSNKAEAEAWNVTWRVIKLGGPLPRAVGLIASGGEDEDEDGAEATPAFGVVVSSDTMLQQTHTMLYCPLICGVNKHNLTLQKKPWHVEVKVVAGEKSGQVGFAPLYMVTKVLLPISPNEVNTDGLDYGRLHDDSQKDAVKKLRLWFPDFRALG